MILLSVINFLSIVYEGGVLLRPHCNSCLVSVLLSHRLTLPQKIQEETALEHDSSIRSLLAFLIQPVSHVKLQLVDPLFMSSPAYLT